MPGGTGRGTGVEIRKCSKNDGVSLNLPVINGTKTCSLVLRIKGCIYVCLCVCIYIYI